MTQTHRGTVALGFVLPLAVASLLISITHVTAFSAAALPAFHPVRGNSKIALTGSVSALTMVKRSERAFIEKSLEDAMNNDWRVFRAHLVAQEQVESTKTPKKNNSNNRKDNTNAASNSNNKGDDKNAKQGGNDLGDMFADAISSIFSKREKDARHDVIFDGDTVGGVSLPNEEILNCEDPFVSREELPILINSGVAIDKHRWAHTIPHVEPGCVLVANEKLGGVFHQTVVLIIDHCESQGSTGIIINRYAKSMHIRFTLLFSRKCVY